MPYTFYPFFAVEIDYEILEALLKGCDAWSHLHKALESFFDAENQEQLAVQHGKDLLGDGSYWESAKTYFPVYLGSWATRHRRKLLRIHNDKEKAAASRDKVADLNKEDIDAIVDPLWDGFVLQHVNSLLNSASFTSHGGKDVEGHLFNNRRKAAMDKTEKFKLLLEGMGEQND